MRNKRYILLYIPAQRAFCISKFEELSPYIHVIVAPIHKKRTHTTPNMILFGSMCSLFLNLYLFPLILYRCVLFADISQQFSG